ncbi:hypothetical protein IFM89_007218 [Coptis chinensis]|uniref:SnoaL-like domain-containing protein n=1 Tax=Coptis chinensis TaxID=261450 RepID=A0A835GZL2_9MAGN|nr:hypothetical protein IFM89_007218 [Coptis chinensis]
MCPIHQTQTRIAYPSFSWKKENVMHKGCSNKQGLVMAASSRDDQLQPGRLTTSDRIQLLYDCINDKNVKKIKEFISDDFCFEDYLFVKPLQGKKEVMSFFEQLT